ncbi:hypothetical protein V1515DRAFT_602834 [Lipomyces mesembrius]
MCPSAQRAWPQFLRSLYSTELSVLPRLPPNSVRYKSSSSSSNSSVQIIDSLVNRITKSTSTNAKREDPEDGTTSQSKQQLDELSTSFRKHLQHSPHPSSSRSKRDESSSPVHAHYSSVISVLDDLITHYRPGLEESQRSTIRVRLPSQKWIDLEVDLKACQRSEDFLKLFEYFFVRGKISPSTAAEILWNPKFSSKDSVLDMKKIVQNQGYLGGWSELRLKTFTSEIEIKLISTEMREMQRTSVSAERIMEYRALISSTFENSWIRFLDQGLSMSNDALRSMWYLVTRAENQFDVVAPTIYRWRASIESTDKNANKNEKVRASCLVNAVTQMWIMAATTGNTRVIEIARNFFSGVPAVYYPPIHKFVFQFVDRLIDIHGERYMGSVASTLKDATLLSNSAVLKKALDVAETMEWTLVKNAGIISLVSDFAAEVQRIANQNKCIIAKEQKSVSDALLLKRVRDLVEKNEGKNDAKSELVHTLLQYA